MRANIPPMFDGDEFAVEDIDRNGYEADEDLPAFAGTDADLSAIIPSFEEGDDFVDFEATELPENIKAFLAQSAQQMNEGLRRGKGDGKQA